jgi:hypothetical protein
MGYGYYVLPDGREAGYAVADVCNREGCDVAIDRSLGYLCGSYPGESPEDGCGLYFCGEHQHDHDCAHDETEAT